MAFSVEEILHKLQISFEINVAISDSIAFFSAPKSNFETIDINFIDNHAILLSICNTFTRSTLPSCSFATMNALLQYRLLIA